MDREYINARQIYKRHIIDDGWSENMPLEVIDVIDLHIQRARKDAQKLVVEQNKKHEGQWIDENIAKSYADKALAYLALYNGQYIGRVRELGEELQRIYGVTELEAINILRNEHIDDYVRKYYRIKNMIPLYINEELIFDRMIESARYAM